MLQLSLLGQIVLSKDGTPLGHFRSQKEVALLIYLAQTGKTFSRDFLADLLWDSSSTAQALSNLRTVLSRLRKKVDDVLLITPRSVSLAQGDQWQADSVRLLQMLGHVTQPDSDSAADTLKWALATYQGDFLAEFDLPDASQFNEWATLTRENIRQQVIAGYDKLGQYACANGRIEDAIHVARGWLQVDGLNEAAHLLLMQMLLKANNRQEALAHYNYYVQLMHTELELPPAPQMTALIRDIWPQQAVSLYRPSPIHHNLPPETDQFFGRKTLQQEIHSRLDQPWCRLVTLAGQGGVGKTRLAITIARKRLSQYVDGVWLVELADIDANDDDIEEAIAVEIATILDMRLNGPEKPVQQLINHLKHKRMLLVVDNFEHLLDGTQLLLDIVQKCEHVQLLVTSREVLQLRAEWAFALTGLSYPPSDVDALSYEAVELFMARQLQQRQGPLAADDLAAIYTICRQVEGLPLAIELAAALTGRATPRSIANRLQDGFGVLTASLRDVPERHRGLHIVFEMSWQMLTPALQQCLARLALFSGSFAAVAAQQIAEVSGSQIEALCEKSLLMYHPSLDRYLLHPIIRAYAGAKRPSTDPTPQKHANYYLTLLAQQTQLLQQNRPQDAVRMLEPELDNIRLAWQTALAQREAELLFKAYPSLSTYYQLRGLTHEGEAVMATTVHTAIEWQVAGLALATRAGLEWGRFQNRLGHYHLAIQTVKTAVKRSQQLKDQWAEGLAHVLWGEALWRLGHYQAATHKLTHALSLGQAIPSATIIGWCHHHLGVINDIQSDYTIARHHLQQACTTWQTTQNAMSLSNSLNSIGLTYYHQGDLPAAQQAMEQALDLCNQLDNRHLQTLLLNNLGIISTDRGDYIGAQYYLRLGLELANRSGNLSGQADIFINLGKNHRLQRELELAEESLIHGLQIAEQIESSAAIAIALIQQAHLKVDQGNLAQAHTLYNQALTITHEKNMHRVECDALISMAQLLGTSNRQEAKQYSAKAVALAQELQNPQLLQQATAVDSALHVA